MKGQTRSKTVIVSAMCSPHALQEFPDFMLQYLIYRERLPFTPAGNKSEALGLDRDSGPLDVLLNVPRKEKKEKNI